MDYCFYHRADLDGKCSAAIVKLAFPYCTLVGVDYQDDFSRVIFSLPFSGKEVVMVDFSLPMPDMQLLQGQVKNLVWLDHHHTAITAAEEIGFNPAGRRTNSLAGCELTWCWFFPSRPMPISVLWLGRFDVWDHVTPEVKPFQLGVRSHPHDPEKDLDFWLLLFSSNQRLIDSLLSDGWVIQRYLNNASADRVKSYVIEREFLGYPAYIINGSGGSSQFDSLPHAREYLLVAFSMTPDYRWRVNLYAHNPGIDCGSLAKAQGGGGHRGAAGFMTDKFPFLPDLKQGS